MKKMMTLLLGLTVALSGCSGSVNGTVAGFSLSVADAIFAVLKDQNGKATGALIVMADKPRICDSLKANREPKSSMGLSIAIARVSAMDSLAPDIGDYTVLSATQAPMNAGNFAYAGFNRNDTTCTSTIAPEAGSAKSGIVKVTNFKGEANGAANGTFDITFGSGDKVTGNFNATFCDISMVQGNPNCE
jgi:hypothetical protein